MSSNPCCSVTGLEYSRYQLKLSGLVLRDVAGKRLLPPRPKDWYMAMQGSLMPLIDGIFRSDAFGVRFTNQTLVQD
jgi:hypothetical protein